MRLFVHIPKNGGMTIRRGYNGIILANPGNHVSPEYTQAVRETMAAHGEHHGYEHARWRDFREDLKNDYRAFGIVRNPYSRTVSRYTFARVTGDKSGQGSFKDFLEERHEYSGLPYFWHRAIRGWYPQKDYVTDEDGIIQCDVLRLESNDVKEYLGLGNELRRRGVSNRGEDYREFYDSECYDIVTEWYREDIEFFGFGFEGPATKNVWKRG